MDSARVEVAIRRRRLAGLVLPIATLVITVTLVGIGLVVDRFDQSHPRPAHLLYVVDADRGTAMWASHD